MGSKLSNVVISFNEAPKGYLREYDALEIRQAAIHCLCVVVVPNTPAPETLATVREIQPHVIKVVVSATAQYRHILQNANAPGGASDAELVAKFLQSCVQSLSQCSQLLRTKVQSEDILPSLLTVAETSLAIGESCFSLCQWVEQQSSHTARGLSQLFTSTCSLLKLSMEHVDLINFGSCSGILIEIIKMIIARLQLMCKAVMYFDASLVILTWKGLGKLVCGVKPLLDPDWTIQPLIASLCAAMETKAQECIQCAPVGQEVASGAYTKLLKVCRFLATLLVKLVKEFEDLSYEFCTEILHLLVTIHSISPPSSLAKEALPSTLQDMDTNVLILREPLISILLESPSFLKRLVSGVDVKKGQHLGWTICLNSLAKFFPKLSDGMQDQLMETEHSQEGMPTTCPMLDAFFNCVEECYVDLCVPILLPGVMCNGQPQSEVSLYDHVCTHLCALVASLPARHYEQLERVLLKNLLGKNVYRSLLASDVWCFSARWGSNDTCLHHVHLLAKLLLNLSSSPAYPVLCSLVRRLFHLLPPQGQTSIIERFDPANPSHLKLWGCLDLSNLCDVQSQLSTCCVTAIMKELSEDVPNQAMLHDTLHGLSSLCGPPMILGLKELVQSSVAAVLMQLLVVMRQGKLTLMVACEVIRLSSLVLVHLQPQHSRTVCSSLCELARHHPPLPVALALALFLSQCGGLQVPAHMQSEVLQCLVEMFQCLLSHRDWLVHHHAMEAFRSFAELTPFGEVVEQCIPQDMTEKVINFLHMTPCRPHQKNNMSDRDLLVHILTERRKKDTALGHVGSSAQLPTTETTTACPPLSEDMPLHDAIEIMKTVWEQVTAGQQELTPANVSELRTLCQSISQYIDGTA